MSSTYQSRTVLFVDICGSTRLYETLGDEAASKEVMRCLELLRSRVEEASGRVIQRVGDELMCLFDTADSALDAARIMQEYVASQAELDRPALAIRIGCHFGPVIEREGDLFGGCVNVAARAAAFAEAGQVITTEQTVTELSATLRQRVRPLGRFAVKGKREDLTMYELVWQDNDEPTTATGTRTGGLGRSTQLVLRYAGEELSLDSGGRPALMLGRDAACDVVVANPKASRRHARIETRREKFVLIDQSVNGTYVSIAGDDEIALRHEELILYAYGHISFGRRAVDEDSELMRFVCR
ncbi:MAG TPA: adenylate/guanylate cyclase domain-containing protein [Burkholderiales bacterium]|nr:adenylate/guanylate cyclase domain-containing protein [Burkholderiales bacterium]